VTRCAPLPVALVLWIVAEGARAVTIPGAVPWLRDIAAAVVAGPRVWPALFAWGSRSRGLDGMRGVKQEKADGCGAAALQWLLGAHDRDVPQNLLWSLTRLPQGGTSARRLARIGTRFGLACRVQRLASAPAPALLPAIVHLRRGHFVVLEQVRGGTARLFDPACGGVLVRSAVLERQMSGIIITCARPEPETGVARGGRGGR